MICIFIIINSNEYITPKYYKKPYKSHITISFDNFINILIHISLIIYNRGIYKNKYEYKDPIARLNAMIRNIKRCHITLFSCDLLYDEPSIPNTEYDFIDSLNLEDSTIEKNNTSLSIYKSPKVIKTKSKPQVKNYYIRSEYFKSPYKKQTYNEIIEKHDVLRKKHHREIKIPTYDLLDDENDSEIEFKDSYYTSIKENDYQKEYSNDDYKEIDDDYTYENFNNKLSTIEECIKKSNELLKRL